MTGTVGASSRPPTAAGAAESANAMTATERRFKSDELRSARRVGRTRRAPGRRSSAGGRGQTGGGGESNDRHHDVLRLDEHAADVPGVVGDRRVRPGNLAERRAGALPRRPVRARQ